LSQAIVRSTIHRFDSTTNFMARRSLQADALMRVLQRLPTAIIRLPDPGILPVPFQLRQIFLRHDHGHGTEPFALSVT
jgi:hypothetical protein